MFIAGFLLGALSYILFSFLGYFVWHYLSRKKSSDEEIPSIVNLPGRARRHAQRHIHTPKSVSEAEQWKKEQMRAPLDPGI